MKQGKLFKNYVQFPMMRLFRNNTTRRVLWWVIFFLLSFAILSTNFVPDQVSLEAGEVAPKDVFYEGATVTYTSELKTDEARRLAAEEVSQIYRMEPQVVTDLESEIENIFNVLTEIQLNTELEQAEKTEKINDLFPEALPAETVAQLLNSDESTLSKLKEQLQLIVRNRMETGVLEEELDSVNEEILKDIEALK